MISSLKCRRRNYAGRLTRIRFHPYQKVQDQFATLRPFQYFAIHQNIDTALGGVINQHKTPPAWYGKPGRIEVTGR
jgi:hypothetical protein